MVAQLAVTPYLQQLTQVRGLEHLHDRINENLWNRGA